MKCRYCNSTNTSVTVTEHHSNETWRYCKCGDCSARYKTIETYAIPKRGSKPGSSVHPRSIKKGESNGSSVLTEKNIRHIRLLAETTMTYDEIATKFGIHKSTVYRIVKRKMWAHV